MLLIKSAEQKGESEKCVTAQFKMLECLIRLMVHPDDHISCEKRKLSETARTNGGWVEQASAFRSTEVEEGGKGQSRQNAEAASEARGSGGGWHGGREGTSGLARKTCICSVIGRCLSSPAHYRCVTLHR